MEGRSAFIFMALSLIGYIINVQSSTSFGQIPVYLMQSEVFIFLMHLWVGEWDKLHSSEFTWKDA